MAALVLILLLLLLGLVSHVVGHLGDGLLAEIGMLQLLVGIVLWGI